jgi:hypothetical protein
VPNLMVLGLWVLGLLVFLLGCFVLVFMCSSRLLWLCRVDIA